MHAYTSVSSAIPFQAYIPVQADIAFTGSAILVPASSALAFQA